MLNNIIIMLIALGVTGCGSMHSYSYAVKLVELTYYDACIEGKESIPVAKLACANRAYHYRKNLEGVNSDYKLRN
jgi:hypothetical protein